MFSQPRHHRTLRNRRDSRAVVPRVVGGFTLLELLVVIGILAVVASILLPVIGRVRRQGSRTIQETALNNIAQALEAYKSDFGDYPRFDTKVLSTGPDAPDGGALNDNSYRGAQLLARALFGPAPKNDPSLDDDPAQNSRDEVLAAYQDGADGYGFKKDRQVVTESATANASQAYYLPGKTYGPYLEPERWVFGTYNANNQVSVVREDISTRPNLVLLDRNDMPILYYPALRKSPDIFNGTGFVAAWDAARPLSLYNASDNYSDNNTPGDPTDDIGAIPEVLLRIMLGDLHDGTTMPTDTTMLSPNGRIDQGETPATNAPFLLIATGERGVRDAAGTDYEYGPDSVANFTPAAPDVTRIPSP